ncbi:MAG: hypothetical protein KC549_14740, partial [Myxococcales bacterium]|nr:hypothetical protein [Myxococcales bacterium]
MIRPLALATLALIGCGDGFPPRPAEAGDAAVADVGPADAAPVDVEPPIDGDDEGEARAPDAAPPATPAPGPGELLINEVDYAAADDAQYI